MPQLESYKLPIFLLFTPPAFFLIQLCPLFKQLLFGGAACIRKDNFGTFLEVLFSVTFLGLNFFLLQIFLLEKNK